MPIISRGYVIKDGKIMRDPKHGNVSKRLRLIKSKKKRVVSKAKALITRSYRP